ncbi:hypothetical protein HWI79_3131 [Cryptosporidium felis]|nr:hypothetical protein HWI79_3131 [Cryptosporidium felis]
MVLPVITKTKETTAVTVTSHSKKITPNTKNSATDTISENLHGACCPIVTSLFAMIFLTNGIVPTVTKHPIDRRNSKKLFDLTDKKNSGSNIIVAKNSANTPQKTWTL